MAPIYPSDMTLVSIALQRNGVGGEPYHAIMFSLRVGNNWRLMLATLFDAPGHVAVLDSYSAHGCNVSADDPPFGNGWRGDAFEQTLRGWAAEYDRTQIALSIPAPEAGTNDS